MAKNDVKNYILSRFTTLNRELGKNKDDLLMTSSLNSKIEEVKNMASNFGVKTKELDKIKAEIEA